MRSPDLVRISLNWGITCLPWSLCSLLAVLYGTTLCMY